MCLSLGVLCVFMGFSCIFNIFAASVTGPALYGPSYIANSLVHDLASETLRSSAAGLLGVPSKSPKKMEDAAFVNYSPKLWNTLQ